MTRKALHAAFAPRLDALESRILLSGDCPAFRPARLAALIDRVGHRGMVAAAAGRAHAARPSAARGPERISAAVVPNDPFFGDLWGLNNGNDVDIDAPEAWNVSTGRPSVVVAVIDTGIDLTHPEFAGRIWTNPGEIADNGVDDDGDGYVDDVHGWNFVSNTNDVQDDNGHGTHVSGTIAAAGNDGVGVAGVAWNVAILPLKVLGSDGEGSLDAAIAAIAYAAKQGARVINASWALDSSSPQLNDAIRAAGRSNVVFVNAAGNNRANLDRFAGRSSADRSRPSNEITVAAIDATGNLTSFSNFGKRSVDVAAPGVGVWSTVPGGYASYTGTSMATPHVTGVVALLASVHPEYSADQLVAQVLSTTKSLPRLARKLRTGGMVDAAYALGVPGSSGPKAARASGKPRAAAVAFGGGRPAPAFARAAWFGMRGERATPAVAQA